MEWQILLLLTDITTKIVFPDSPNYEVTYGLCHLFASVMTYEQIKSDIIRTVAYRYSNIHQQ
jgi:hypothetical protein